MNSIDCTGAKKSEIRQVIKKLRENKILHNNRKYVNYVEDSLIPNTKKPIKEIIFLFSSAEWMRWFWVWRSKNTFHGKAIHWKEYLK